MLSSVEVKIELEYCLIDVITHTYGKASLLVVSDTQIVMKGKQAICSFQNFFFLLGFWN
jgi:hypothetical protein